QAWEGPAPSGLGLIVRTTSAPMTEARSITASIRDVNPDIVITFRPLTGFVDAAMSQERIVAMLSGFFGALALLLAALGLYGITSYAVSRRRGEIGIRMALGAAPAGVVFLVLRGVALLVGGGLLFGTLASLWATRFVDTLVWGLTPRDPLTLAGAAAVL